MSLKPKIYKKTLYLGDRKLLKLTKESIRKFLFKSVWASILIIMALTMVLGSIAIFLPQENPQVITIGN